MTPDSLLYEIAQSPDNTLFHTIATVLTWLLVLVSGVVLVVGAVRLWNNRFRDKD